MEAFDKCRILPYAAVHADCASWERVSCFFPASIGFYACVGQPARQSVPTAGVVSPMRCTMLRGCFLWGSGLWTTEYLSPMCYCMSLCYCMMNRDCSPLHPMPSQTAAGTNACMHCAHDLQRTVCGSRFCCRRSTVLCIA